METTKKERIVKVTFTGLNATVYVKNLKGSTDFDIESLPDEVKTFLLQYGWKQKVSDFRATDKLKGQEKLDAIKTCHEMLESGETRIKGETTRMSNDDKFVQWQTFDDTTKKNLSTIDPALYRKMMKMESEIE
jgi:hypothetical protein